MADAVDDAMDIEDNKEEKDNDEEEEEESEEEESSEEEVPEPRVMPSRRGRGARMIEQLKNIDNEDYWKDKQLFDLDEENEIDYSTESDEEDVVDSDFDESEADDSDGEVKVVKEKKKKRNVYVDPSKRPGKKRAPLGAPTSDVKTEPSSGSGGAIAADASEARPAPKSSASLAPSAPLERRKSTRTSTIENSEDLRKREVEQSKQVKRKSTRKKHRVLTQDEQFEEAKQTEELNRESLKRLLAEEEQAKKIDRAKKPKYTGPRIIFHSRAVNGNEKTRTEKVNISYTHGDFTVYKKPTLKRNSEKPPVCLVTGLAARYSDPLTKLPYANITAFKQLRDMYAKDPKGLARRAEKLGLRLFG
ncbi:hypothetical protein AAMO2058_001531900 [Amorphochlora amoebiformis]